MAHRPDYILDVAALTPTRSAADTAAPADHATSAAAPPAPNRPWLAMLFRCCHVYSRIYRSRDRSAYAGRCPGCGRHVHIQISPDGTASRFFEAR